MTKPVVRKHRCAVYTRKSSEEGLDMEFNSLDAQREACEAYVASQRAEGWLLVRDRYDDGGYSGGTLDRPAGSSIRLGDALERMITISDNSSAILLTDRVGAFNINQDMRSIGLQHTRLILDDLVTSPGDMLTFLDKAKKETPAIGDEI